MFVGTSYYLNPSTIFEKDCWESEHCSFTPRQLNNLSNLKDNRTKGSLSIKSQRKIRKMVNWLVVSAKPKRCWNPSTKSHFTFKINFITLTLHAGEHRISDRAFRRDILRPWLNAMKYSHQLRNYIWKLERTKEGVIHCHITTDTYIPYLRIRSVWNRILKKNGLLSEYHRKFSCMDYQEYERYMLRYSNIKPDNIPRAFSEGRKSNWYDPNSTDVHSVRKVKDLAAYLSKYFTKAAEDDEGIEGVIWRACYSLSRAIKTFTHYEGHDNDTISKYLRRHATSQKVIYSNEGDPINELYVGTWFLVSQQFWRAVEHTKLGIAYFNTILSLQMPDNLFFNL